MKKAVSIFLGGPFCHPGVIKQWNLWKSMTWKQIGRNQYSDILHSSGRAELVSRIPLKNYVSLCNEVSRDNFSRWSILPSRSNKTLKSMEIYGLEANWTKIVFWYITLQWSSWVGFENSTKKLCFFMQWSKPWQFFSVVHFAISE